MMEGMPASDSTPKRMHAGEVRFPRVLGEIYGSADPERRGEGYRKKPQEKRTRDGGENAAEPAHIFRVGEDEFHGDVREALDEYDKDYHDQDGDGEEGLGAESRPHHLVGNPRSAPSFRHPPLHPEIRDEVEAHDDHEEDDAGGEEGSRWSPVAYASSRAMLLVRVLNGSSKARGYLEGVAGDHDNCHRFPDARPMPSIKLARMPERAAGSTTL